MSSLTFEELAALPVGALVLSNAGNHGEIIPRACGHTSIRWDNGRDTLCLTDFVGMYNADGSAYRSSITLL
jgi:hypothetical protein